jgi:hypothetical protein
MVFRLRAFAQVKGMIIMSQKRVAEKVYGEDEQELFHRSIPVQKQELCSKRTRRGDTLWYDSLKCM